MPAAAALHVLDRPGKQVRIGGHHFGRRRSRHRGFTNIRILRVAAGACQVLEEWRGELVRTLRERGI